MKIGTFDFNVRALILDMIPGFSALTDFVSKTLYQHSRTSTPSINGWQIFLTEMNAAFGLIQKSFSRTFNVEEHRSYQKDEVISSFSEKPENLDLARLSLKLFKEDKEFVLKLIAINPHVFTLIDKKSKNNKEFALEAIKANPDSALLIDKSLRQDPAFMKKVMIVLVEECCDKKLEDLISELALTYDERNFAYHRADECAHQLSPLAISFPEVSQARGIVQTEEFKNQLEKAVSFRQSRVQPELLQQAFVRQQLFKRYLLQAASAREPQIHKAIDQLEKSLEAQSEARLAQVQRARQIQCERLDLVSKSSDQELELAVQKHAQECSRYGINPSSTKKQLAAAISFQKEQKIEAQLEKMEKILVLNERIKKLEVQLTRYELPSLRQQFRTLISERQTLRKEIKNYHVDEIEELKVHARTRLTLGAALLEEIKEQLGLGEVAQDHVIASVVGKQATFNHITTLAATALSASIDEAKKVASGAGRWGVHALNTVAELALAT